LTLLAFVDHSVAVRTIDDYLLDRDSRPENINSHNAFCFSSIVNG